MKNKSLLYKYIGGFIKFLPLSSSATSYTKRLQNNE